MIPSLTLLSGLTLDQTSSSDTSLAVCPEALEQAVGLVAEGRLNHIAVIMDGNRRWAKAHNKPGFQGHVQGYGALRELVRFCQDRLHLPVLTVYAFSTENWNRTPPEVTFLTQLLKTAIHDEFSQLIQNNIQVRFIGDLSAFSPAIEAACHKLNEQSLLNTGMRFQIALNYGGRAEIVAACRRLMGQVEAGQLRADAFDEAMLTAAMYTAEVPDPDMIIRTGGESRLSNFLLWQSAYAEIMVRQELWPDFTPGVLLDTISTFAGRQRRYGV